jgi:tetratricopeptide (TPR) repeat protein
MAIEPSPEDSAETLWAMLDALRRKLDDNATVGRKTQQAMVQLADSLAAQVASNRKRTRWLNLNSFVAYLLFTLTIGGGFFLLYRTRSASLVTERSTALRERDAAVDRATRAESAVADRVRGDTAVWNVYSLIVGNKRTEALAALTALPATSMSKTEHALFAELEQRTRAELVDEQFHNGIAAFRAGKLAEVITNLSAALAVESKGARSAQMRYYVGVAQLKQGQTDVAVDMLTQAIAGDVDIEDARYYFAVALDIQGLSARARIEYDRFATKHPLSPFTAQATRRSAMLGNSKTPPLPPMGARDK